MRNRIVILAIALVALLVAGCASCGKCKRGGGPGKNPGAQAKNDPNEDELEELEDERDELKKALDDALADLNNQNNNNLLDPNANVPFIANPNDVPQGNGAGAGAGAGTPVDDSAAPSLRNASATSQLRSLLRSSLGLNTHDSRTARRASGRQLTD